ncbi:MAG: hypothetical protein IKK59_05080 [Lachnospiraceae bacterium]|nr:hypothetical protein [Lachnospiraceae bacterium]
MPICILFVAVISVLLYGFSDGIQGNDFWWHVKVGEWIVQNREIPVKDIFSWYGIEHGIPWTAHEWLSEVIFYLIYHNFHEFGIFIFAFLSAYIMLYLLWRETKKYINQNILICGLFYVLLATVAVSFFYGRPHVFSYLLLFCTLKVLYQYYENVDSKWIYSMPLIAVLWGNLHGGSSNLTYLLCGVFFVSGLCTIKLGCIRGERLSNKWIVRLLIVTMLTVAALTVNPAGIKILSYPYSNMSDDLMTRLISEWQSPDAKNIGHLILFYFPIGMLGIGFVTQNKKIRIIDAFIMILFLFLFLRSIRFIMLWYVAASFCAFPYMLELKVKAIEKKRDIIICIIAFSLLTAVSLMNVAKIGYNLKRGELISKVLSKEVIEFVKSENPQRLFNDYNFGESLIFEDIAVFFDARADVYSGNGMLADGAGLLLLQQLQDKEKVQFNVEEIICKYNFDALLVAKNRPLYVYLISNQENYEVAYEDNVAAYFRITHFPAQTCIQ